MSLLQSLGCTRHSRSSRPAATSRGSSPLADNGQQKAFVLGEPVSRAELPELDTVTVRVRINDTEVMMARGDAVLGHPYNSVAWLASKLAHFGERLSAGDYIMSGSFTRQFPLARGDRIEAVFDGIGAVTTSVV